MVKALRLRLTTSVDGNFWVHASSRVDTSTSTVQQRRQWIRCAGYMQFMIGVTDLQAARGCKVLKFVAKCSVMSVEK